MGISKLRVNPGEYLGTWATTETEHDGHVRSRVGVPRSSAAVDNLEPSTRVVFGLLSSSGRACHLHYLLSDFLLALVPLAISLCSSSHSPLSSMRALTCSSASPSSPSLSNPS